MCQLVETIKCYNGKIYNMPHHNARFNKSRNELFGKQDFIDLAQSIVIPEHAQSGHFKCRVLYHEKIDKIEFTEYRPRKIKWLKVVIDNTIDYPLKYTQRNHIQKLFKQRGKCDDILIVKNGFITDSSTANLIFYDGQKWYTPCTPLLSGTQRAKLLEEGKIFQRQIKIEDLYTFTKASLINALQDLNEMPVIPIGNIIK